jgi:hypothetical protein
MDVRYENIMAVIKAFAWRYWKQPQEALDGIGDVGEGRTF